MESKEQMSATGSPWPSPYSGWFKKKFCIEPYKGPQIPAAWVTKETLKLAVMVNSMMWPFGFEGAFIELPPAYSERCEAGNSEAPRRFLLDSVGNIYQFAGIDVNESEDVFTYITKSLSSRVKALPSTGRDGNSWRIRPLATCEPSHIVYLQQGIPMYPQHKKILVSGYSMPSPSEGMSGRLDSSPRIIDLEETIGGFDTLPAALDELFGLALELGGETLEERNLDLIQAIKQVVAEPSRYRTS